jgi:hypothetical protein
LRQAAPFGAGVPRLSTLATMKPSFASARWKSAVRAPHLSTTVWLAGSP